jgi:UPF0716 family protein affecting phage T7 exclusion
MERNLYGSKADVHPARPAGRPSYRSLVIGIIVLVAGIVVLVVGVTSQLIVVGVVGFAIMFAGTVLAAKPGKPSEVGSTRAQAKSGTRSRSSFMQRMEQRWDNRGQDQ